MSQVVQCTCDILINAQRAAGVTMFEDFFPSLGVSCGRNESTLIHRESDQREPKDPISRESRIAGFRKPQRINPARRRRSAVGAVIVTRVASVESISCDLVTVSTV